MIAKALDEQTTVSKEHARPVPELARFPARLSGSLALF